MAKKRKAVNIPTTRPAKSFKYDVDETFTDSEDEFYQGQDKILLDESRDSKRRQRIEDQERELHSSDEEVLGYGEDEEIEDEDEADLSDEDREDESEDGAWGNNRADYYNADVIETEADALEEEAEAKRLDQKRLHGMTAADFGFDETTWAEPDQTQAKKKRPVVEKLPDQQIPLDASDEDKFEILRNRYPEFEPLARDFIDLQPVKKELEIAIEAENELKANTLAASHGVSAQTKYQALSTYLATIALYFAVLSSQVQSENDSSRITSINPLELREHAVIQSLANARRIWDELKNLPIARLTIASQDETPEINGAPRVIAKAPKQPKESKQFRPVPDVVIEERPIQKKSKRTASKHKDLQSLLANSAIPAAEDSDFGDESPLTDQQAAEKAKKRKSLRFYTSQLAQKANKRGTASRQAGGDDDLPYKERNRDRQERLLREAQARGQAQADEQEELGGEDDGEPDTNDYYSSLVADSHKKKADKKAKADLYAEAARQGAQVHQEETVGPDGKRAITYAIQKNKGLTPKRKKDVRNPRVKKRKKFDEKMKKLGSIRQVYKGGEGRGGYGGELTGIKTNVVKGIRL